MNRTGVHFGSMGGLDVDGSYIDGVPMNIYIFDN